MSARGDALAGRFPAKGYSEGLLRTNSGQHRVAIAESFLARLKGLMLRPTREGDLPLAFDFRGGAASMHSAMMLGTIGIAYIDPSGRPIRSLALRPWRVAPLVEGCGWAVEASPETLRAMGIGGDACGIITIERRMRSDERGRQ